MGTRRSTSGRAKPSRIKYHYLALLGEDLTPPRGVPDLRAGTRAVKDDPLGEVLRRYDFYAVSDRGAMRAASEWLNREYGEGTLGWGDWQWVDTQRNRRVRWTPHGWLILTPVADFEEAEHAPLVDLIETIRGDPASAYKRYEEHPDELRESLWKYFRHELLRTAGEISDALWADAEMLYDWPGIPTLLSDALQHSPKELRRALGKGRDLRCPSCKQAFYVRDERCHGGYSEESYVCGRCRVRLIGEQDFQNVRVWRWLTFEDGAWQGRRLRDPGGSVPSPLLVDTEEGQVKYEVVRTWGDAEEPPPGQNLIYRLATIESRLAP